MINIYRQIPVSVKKSTGQSQYKKLSLMRRKYKGIINEISNPVDSTNRFINLALNTVGDDSQSRQFLLESKQGIKKTAALLKRLNDYSLKIEKEIVEMSKINE